MRAGAAVVWRANFSDIGQKYLTTDTMATEATAERRTGSAKSVWETEAATASDAVVLYGTRVRMDM